MPSVEYARKMALAAKYGTGITGLWKRGWNEIPEVMGSTIFLIIGYVGLAYKGYEDYMKENRTLRFKRHYTIYRPDDKMVGALAPHITALTPKPTSTPPGFVHTPFAMQCKPEFR